MERFSSGQEIDTMALGPLSGPLMTLDGSEDQLNLIARRTLVLSEDWGGFWEFGDDSPAEIRFMGNLQDLMRLCQEFRRARKPSEEARHA